MKRNQLLDRLEEYANLQERAVDLLIQGILNYIEDKALYSVYEEIDVLERRADSTRRELVGELARGAFFAFLSEDFIRAINLMDEIADYSRAAVKLIVESKIDNTVFKKIGSEKLKAFLDSVRKSVNSLKEALITIEKGRREAVIEKIQLIELYEEEADDIKDDLTRRLFEEKHLFNPLDILIAKEVMSLIDNVADTAEDVGDVLLSIIAKGYK